jgi:hypothetical protein
LDRVRLQEASVGQDALIGAARDVMEDLRVMRASVVVSAVLRDARRQMTGTRNGLLREETGKTVQSYARLAEEGLASILEALGGAPGPAGGPKPGGGGGGGRGKGGSKLLSLNGELKLLRLYQERINRKTAEATTWAKEGREVKALLEELRVSQDGTLRLTEELKARVREGELEQR